MEILRPGSLHEALEMKAAQPEAKPIAGGTDVMVELNFDRVRPLAMLDLTRIPELAEWGTDNGSLRIGAGVTYTRLIEELADRLPGLAIASRTVGSPQIRNRGTVGGNLASASPAGDCHPPLLAAGAPSRAPSQRPTTLPIASRRTDMPAARIQSATASPASRSAPVAKRRVSRSGSSLNAASASQRSSTVAASSIASGVACRVVESKPV